MHHLPRHAIEFIAAVPRVAVVPQHRACRRAAAAASNAWDASHAPIAHRAAPPGHRMGSHQRMHHARRVARIGHRVEAGAPLTGLVRAGKVSTAAARSHPAPALPRALPRR
jgi:hypothetical protein